MKRATGDRLYVVFRLQDVVDPAPLPAHLLRELGETRPVGALLVYDDHEAAVAASGDRPDLVREIRSEGVSDE